MDCNSAPSNTREQCLYRIESLSLQFLRDLVAAAAAPKSSTVDLPAVILSDMCHSVMTEDGHFHTSTTRRQKLQMVPKNHRRLARLFGALDAVHYLNTKKRTATQRELFYRSLAEAPSLFHVQSTMNDALRDVVGTLQIGRPHLGVLTTEKGLVAGAISFRDPQTMQALSASQGGCGLAITEAMLHGEDGNIELGHAHCVLVVEKDTFFQHLLQGRLLLTLPLILVTGRGFPDALTRRLLQRLQRLSPNLPQVYLGDYDPHGISIFLTYRSSCPALHWLGMHHTDVKDFPAEASLPLSRRDKALRASLLQHPQVLGNEAFSAEIQNMQCKFELEALHAVHGAEQIARHFVPEKILRRCWI